MSPRLGVAALSALVFVVAAGPAQAAPDVFAHRGGAYVRGKPQFPENTLPAFGVAALQRDPLEFDIKLTADGVPVVIHDPTLDRTTNCSGRVVDKTLAQLRRCRADVLGVPGPGLPTRHVADPSVGVPRWPTCSPWPAAPAAPPCRRSRTTRPTPTTTRRWPSPPRPRPGSRPVGSRSIA
jgi:glycerophosphoryl diester phosphodiesterase